MSRVRGAETEYEFDPLTRGEDATVARPFRTNRMRERAKARVRSQAAKHPNDRRDAVDFQPRLGFVALVLEFPRPILLAHRLLFAAVILYNAPSIWRMFLRPVTMLSDFPATVFAPTLILAGFLPCWLNGKAFGWSWPLMRFSSFLPAFTSLEGRRIW